MQRRVSALAAVLTAMTLAVAIVLVLGTSALMRNDQETTNKWDAATEATRSYRMDLVRLQVAESAYRAGDQSQVDAVRSGRAGLVADETSLMDALTGIQDSDGDTQSAEIISRAESMLTRVRAWQRALSLNDESAAASGQPGRPDPQAFDIAYDAAEVLTEALQKQRSEVLDDTQSTQTQLFFTQALVLIVMLLLIPSLLYLVRRWLVNPLAELSDQLRHAGDGDLETPLGLPGPPELSAVAASAELMRRRINTELERALSAQEALQQGQPLVAEVRDQLAAHEIPMIAGWSSAAVLRPAEGLLAGDWYDVLPVADGRFAVVLADVSGHGARAGIVAIQLKRLLEAALHLYPDPDFALAMAGRLFADEHERFASCVVVVVDPDSGVVTYANAGHPAPLVLRRDEHGVRVVSELVPTGPLLSWLTVDMPTPWETRTLSMAPGSVLFTYTDGLTEARPVGSPDDLGVEGVLEALDGLDPFTPEVIVAEALEVARHFSGGRVRDDITLVAIARDGHPRSTPARRTGEAADAQPSTLAQEAGSDPRPA